MGKRQVLIASRAATIIITIAAIAWAMYETTSAGTFDPTRFFAYFTIQSNLIVVVLFGWLLVNGDRPRSRALESFRGAATGYMTVVFFVVIFLLSNVDVGLRLAWVDVVLHKVVPIVVVLDWLVDPPTVRLGARDALAWIVYPLIWTGLTLVRGAADGWYPYPFLGPSEWWVRHGRGHGRRDYHRVPRDLGAVDLGRQPARAGGQTGDVSGRLSPPSSQSTAASTWIWAVLRIGSPAYDGSVRISASSVPPRMSPSMPSPSRSPAAIATRRSRVSSRITPLTSSSR